MSLTSQTHTSRKSVLTDLLKNLVLVWHRHDGPNGLLLRQISLFLFFLCQQISSSFEGCHRADIIPPRILPKMLWLYNNILAPKKAYTNVFIILRCRFRINVFKNKTQDTSIKPKNNNNNNNTACDENVGRTICRTRLTHAQLSCRKCVRSALDVFCYEGRAGECVVCWCVMLVLVC